MDTMTMFWIGGAVYLVICAGAGCYVADQKGRSMVEATLFAVGFGPLGVLIVACLPTLSSGDAQAAEQPEEEGPEDLDRRLRRAMK